MRRGHEGRWGARNINGLGVFCGPHEIIPIIISWKAKNLGSLFRYIMDNLELKDER